MPSGISELLDKLRRAHRNETGATFSNEQLKLMAKHGVLHLLAKAEADEIVEGLTPTKKPLGRPPSTEQDREVYSPRTLAQRWDCSPGLIRSMIARGELKSFRHGNLIRISREAVEEVEARRG